MSEIKFSIITPCYRAGAYLNRLHDSLKLQRASHKDFEWILVDDFSDDEGITKSLMEDIQLNSEFSVKCVFLNKNFYGSRSAHAGSMIANGEYTIILDQDDILANNALRTIASYIKANDKRTGFAGVCGRCKDAYGKLIGKPFSTPEIYANELWIRHKGRYRGEFFQCTKTHLIKKYFEGMLPGYTNGWVWSRLAQDYSFLYINDVLRHYDTRNPASVSNSGRVRWVHNVYKQINEYLHLNIKYAIIDPIFLIKMSVHCVRFKFHAKECGAIEKSPGKLILRTIFAAISPLAYILYKFDKHKKRVSCN